MKLHINDKPLEKRLLILQDKAAHHPLSIGEILQILSGKGKSLILILLSISFCQPLQIPGLSTPFGLAIAFIGLRMAFGKRVWLPKKLLSKEIKTTTLKKITTTTLWLVRKVHRFIHPRLQKLCHHPAMQITNGLMIALLGLFLALPLPVPFSNLVAAWSIFLLAFGILEDDGLLILLGYLVALLAALFLAFIIFQIHLWL